MRLEHPVAGVALVVLDAPDRRNALGPGLANELAVAIATVAADDAARALVVSGEGSAFCAGADLPAIFGGDNGDTIELRGFLRRYYRSFLALLELPIPTIAAVDGPAIGAGLNLALSCDIRLAGEHAAFGATFTRLGLHPGGGCTWFLVRALGRQRALRILVEGATLDAATAVARGLADELVPDARAAALDLAQRIAALDTGLVRDVKTAVRLADEQGLDASLEFEAWAQAASAQSDRVTAAVARFAARE